MPNFTLVVLTLIFAVSTYAHEGTDHGGVATSFDSELEVQVQDDFVNPSKTRYFVKDRNGKKKELEFPAGMERPNFLSGQKISVHGHVHSNKPDHLLLDQPVAAIGVIISAGTTATGGYGGVKDVLAIITDFDDATVSCTDSAINSTLFGEAPVYSTKEFFKETSRGALTVQGQVIRVRLPRSIGTRCESTELNAWMSDARAEAAKVMSTLGYENTMIILPTNAPCPFSGLGGLGWGSSWVKTCNYGSVYTHELGHNFNLHHAATPGAEYGDSSDVMGSGYAWEVGTRQ
jgi:hypothetical protein